MSSDAVMGISEMAAEGPAPQPREQPATRDAAPARDLVIDARDVSKCYRIYPRPTDRFKQAFAWGRRQFYREFWALRDVSLDVRGGEMLGIIGRNGSGKSTLLQIIAGTLAPSAGEVRIGGRVAALLELGSGFHPDATGRENIFMNAAILGLSEQQVQAKYDEIVAFADIGEFIHQPVKTYSSGMAMRVAFSVAAHVDASVLIVDEALSVGDAAFQAKCFRRIAQLREAGTTILLATHDLATLNQMCERALLLDRGQTVALGPAKSVSQEYYRRVQETERIEIAASAPSTAWAAAPDARELEPPISTTAARMGDLSAEIIGWGLWDGAGRRGRVLAPRETARFELRIVFNQDMQQPHAGVALRDVHSRIIQGAHTLFESLQLGPLRAGEELTLALSFPVLVNPGTYLLMFGVADHPTPNTWRDCDVHFDVCEVQVVGEQRAWGVVNAPAQIKILSRIAGRQEQKP
jgi:lipopolysaccharide transport system ATP-binding protein